MIYELSVIVLAILLIGCIVGGIAEFIITFHGYLTGHTYIDPEELKEMYDDK